MSTPVRKAVRPPAALAELAGRVTFSGRFWLAETGTGDIVVFWQPDDHRHAAGEVRLPGAIVALARAAAAGEKISFGAIARAMRGSP